MYQLCNVVHNPCHDAIIMVAINVCHLVNLFTLCNNIIDKLIASIVQIFLSINDSNICVIRNNHFLLIVFALY